MKRCCLSAATSLILSHCISSVRGVLTRIMENYILSQTHKSYCTLFFCWIFIFIFFIFASYNPKIHQCLWRNATSCLSLVTNLCILQPRNARAASLCSWNNTLYSNRFKSTPLSSYIMSASTTVQKVSVEGWYDTAE